MRYFYGEYFKIWIFVLMVLVIFYGKGRIFIFRRLLYFVGEEIFVFYYFRWLNLRKKYLLRKEKSILFVYIKYGYGFSFLSLLYFCYLGVDVCWWEV